MLGAKYTELEEAVCEKYVRTLRALIKLSHPEQPHLGPTSLGPRDLFKLQLRSLSPSKALAVGASALSSAADLVLHVVLSCR